MPCALITGVSSGLGHGLASGYLDRDWRVLGTSRRTPEDLVQRERFKFAACDLRDQQAVGPTVTSLVEGHDRLDLAILNAGVLGHFGDLPEQSIDQMRDVMETNVWATKRALDAIFALGIQIGQDHDVELQAL